MNMISSVRTPAATALVALLIALCSSTASGVVIPPAGRAIELPPGVTAVAGDDPVLAPILDAAVSTVGGQVVHNLGESLLTPGKHYVTWRDLADGTTASAYIYLYPYGWQVLGRTDNLRVFEHNGARHLLYDSAGRLHAIYNDGTAVWYRLAVRSGNRMQWLDPVQVNDRGTPIASSTWGTRGQTLTLHEDADGSVIVDCVWSASRPDQRSILIRRLVVDPAGSVTASEIRDTGLRGSFTCLVIDSTGRLHLAVEVYSSIVYACSDDGINWTGHQWWYAWQTSGTACRFPNLVVDSQDRLHLLYQAEGYNGYSGSSTWWVGLYTVRDPVTGTWASLQNVLQDFPEWGAPSGGRDVLLAYPNLLIDDRDNLHLSWHGTVRSGIFAWDDVFYMRRMHDPIGDTWLPWSDYAILHARDHFGTGDGEDADFTWVPSLAYVPGEDTLYALIMFGTGDDEVTDPAVNLTDSLLKTYQSGGWLAGSEDVTDTQDLRSWYANVPPRAWVDPNGRAWLDMIWVDGTLGDYNVLFRRIDLGGGLEGDCDGDGYVCVRDLLLMARSFGLVRGDAAFDARADLNFDNGVNAQDLLILANNFGRTR